MNAAEPLTPGPPAPRLTYSALARFHAPLAASAWSVTLLGPLLNVCLLRASAPRAELGAFWVAYSILFVAQGLCMVTQQAGVLLARRPGGMRSLASVAGVLGAGASLALAALALTPAGHGLLGLLLPAAPERLSRIQAALLPLSLVPALVAVRGVALGAAVLDRRTAVSAGAALLRLLALAFVVLAGGQVLGPPGAVTAARALSAAVAVETSFAILAARRGRFTASAGVHAPPVTPRAAWAIVVPLATMPLGWTLARPLVNAVLARLAHGEAALAGFGVVLPLVLATAAPLWPMLDVALVLPGSAFELRRVLRFAAAWSAVCTLALGAIAAWPPLAWWIAPGARLPAELAALVTPVLPWLIPLPALVAARAIAQALLIRAGATVVLLVQAPVKLAVVAAAGMAFLRFLPDVNGVAIGVVLVLCGELADTFAFGFALARRRGALAVQALAGTAYAARSTGPDAALQEAA